MFATRKGKERSGGLRFGVGFLGVSRILYPFLGSPKERIAMFWDADLGSFSLEAPHWALEYISYSLNSLKGAIWGIIQGTTTGVI